MIRMKQLKEEINEEYWLSKWPLINSKYIDGYEIIKINDVPNFNSINASVYEYKIWEGIRKVDMKDFQTKNINDLFYSASDIKISKELAEEIDYNKEIAPLIIGVDSEPYPYILEGVHRFGAFFFLNIEYFPAMVFFDYDE